MKKIYRLYPDGTLEGLYDECLTGLGQTEVQRASKVEWDDSAQGWSVEILVGPNPGRLPMVFSKRVEAIQAEVDFLNVLIESGELRCS